MVRWMKIFGLVARNILAILLITVAISACQTLQDPQLKGTSDTNIDRILPKFPANGRENAVWRIVKYNKRALIVNLGYKTNAQETDVYRICRNGIVGSPAIFISVDGKRMKEARNGKDLILRPGGCVIAEGSEIALELESPVTDKSLQAFGNYRRLSDSQDEKKSVRFSQKSYWRTVHQKGVLVNRSPISSTTTIRYYRVCREEIPNNPVSLGETVFIEADGQYVSTHFKNGEQEAFLMSHSCFDIKGKDISSHLDLRSENDSSSAKGVVFFSN